VKIIRAFARQYFHSISIYRFDFWLRAASILPLMYAIRWLWIALYSQHPGAFDSSLNQMVSYGVLAIAVQSIFYTDPHYYMARQARSGAIDGDLMKPLDFHLHMLARSTGEVLFRLTVLVLPALVIGFFMFDLQLPKTVLSGIVFIFSLLIGCLINFHLEFLLGSIALVTFEIHSIDWAFDSLSRFFSGQIVPLWLFPGFLGFIAQVLPFKCLFSIPLSIYTGKITDIAILQSVVFQLLWLTILIFLSRKVWHQVHLRLSVQGG
jgi:ABC-2 type transport system permease protein